MARGRMIDKRVGMSKKLGKISDKAARLYFMIYPHLDKKGRIAFDNLEDLKDEIIPKIKKWSLKKIADALNEMADIELIQLYPNTKKIAMQFERFRDFQTIREDREAKSKVIAPGVAPENSGVFRITPALSLSLRKSKEGRKEVILEVEEVYFDFEKRKWINIKEEDKETWKDAYPGCNINQELKKMIAWLLGDWPRRKKINYKKFITGWLSRTQDKGGSKTASTDEINAWAEKQARKEKK